jgi:23S rRNA (cytosine1962-C5)-methyltransferase
VGGVARGVALLVKPVVPCVIHEDEDLLVVNKPAGMNTHAPGLFAGEGIYEWLKHREPRWSRLAIIHRLDKEVSGVMVFGKTPAANRSLTEQFTSRNIRKKYRLLTDRQIEFKELNVVSTLARTGERYTSRPLTAGSERAETHFKNIASETDRIVLEAGPITGRTHQIRVQAAASGFPILGDTLYGGTAGSRVCLHSVELGLKHPSSGVEMNFQAPADFDADARMTLRMALINLEETNAFRVVHGAADGRPGWQVERLGDFLYFQTEQPIGTADCEELRRLTNSCDARGAYQKISSAQIRRPDAKQASPQHIWGDAAPETFAIRENGLRFELSFNEGGSYGLFLDQRDNRRRLLTNHVAADFPLFPKGAASAEVLNLFAYTCGFSVCAAKAGTRATSVDLSKKYLEWGRRNFALNHLDPAAHDFIYGDAFDWLRRLGRKGRAFDLIILDPPTFSHSKEHGAFQAEKDFGRLAGEALPLLKPGGVLFASTNAARLKPEAFLEILDHAAKSARRKILRRHYVPQPPDFPIHRLEPAHLKTVWLQFD